MQGNIVPITFNELFNLTSLGINPASIGFSKVTMESQKWVAVREATPQGQAQVIIINTANPANPLRFPVSADSAIMHPSRNVLALKAAQQLQIFDLDQKKKLKDVVMTDPVVFWRWISDATVALVTPGAVFHWAMDGESKPVKMFDRHASLNGADIVNYRSDKDGKWLLLVGYSAVNGQIVGALQLYSVEKKMSQPIEGHAASFATLQVRGNSSPSTLFCFANRSAAQSKIFIIEVEKTDQAGPAFTRVALDIAFPPEAQGDIPIAMQFSEQFSCVYVITKFGYLFVFDVETGKQIYSNRISAEPIFVTVPDATGSGIVGVNKRGQVLSVSLDPAKVVPYIISLGDYGLALRIASRNNLPGANDLFVKQFDSLFNQGKYKEAAQVAAESPAGALRTPDTIRRFQAAPVVPNQPSPLLQYFSVLLESSKLNKIESLELCRPVLAQNRKQLIQEWLDNQKLSCSEELGDLVRQFDVAMALKIYYLAEAKAKVVALFAELGQFDKIAQYCAQVQYQADWTYLLQLVMGRNPAAAVPLAQMLLAPQPNGAPLADVHSIVDIFVQRQLIKEASAILFDVLKAAGDRPEMAALQTRLLEINLAHGHATVVDALLGTGGMTQFDKPRIARLCEQAGLYQRALELYTAFADRKRVMLQTHAINAQWLVDYFANLQQDQGLEVLNEMLATNVRQNLPVVVEVAAKFSDAFGSENLIKLFEMYQSVEGLFGYLQRIVNFSKDPSVHLKYIRAAAMLGQSSEVERIVRESEFYDPEAVRDFLMEQKLVDQLPLVIVCDRFGYVDKLTQYLYQNGQVQFIEAYVQQINPANTPAVVGALLDADCNEDYVSNLIMAVGPKAPAGELIDIAEKRNRLKLLQPWLEARVNESNQEEVVHNALAKIYIDLNRDPKEFLINNQYYNSQVVGQYCEQRDPFLAYVAYRRGLCDDELIRLTNVQGLFKDQARYLVERQDAGLWARVLVDTNEHKRSVVDQVVQTALPESRNSEEVSTTVKAFMTADLPNELIELLEKIVLESSEFSGNRNLQNLLILTAIKAAKERVMDYVTRLENYDAVDIAQIAIGAGLFEEAFTVYKKFKHNDAAIQVLIEHVKDLERAAEFAGRVNEPAVYSKLGRAQLDGNLVKEAIESYIKADDHAHFLDVIRFANKAGLVGDLISFLLMARKKFKNQSVESELAYAYAKTNQLTELEAFISSPNSANVQDVGDRCFAEELFDAARILYASINNHARLASTLIKLGQYGPALDAARKANSLRTWKEVCFECVNKKEFRLAQLAGLAIVVHADHLEEVIRHYENSGHWDELITLLEQGIGLERSHANLFTELGILYSKFRPNKLQEHVKLFHSKLNKTKVIRVCESNLQWDHATFLYCQNHEYDNAALTMMNHSPECWEHAQFKDVLSKVGNQELCYRGIQFYLKQHPVQLDDLLSSLASRIDASRVVKLVRKLLQLPMIYTYLQNVQSSNLLAVNDALNELYVEEGNFRDLRVSIETHSEFDWQKLASSTETHAQLEFRRIAATLYRLNGKYEQSIELSKKDKLWKDVMETAASSKSTELAETVLLFFVENKLTDCFAAALLTCYDLIRPDVALEIAWSHNLTDFVMPFLIQALREYIPKIREIDQRTQPPKPEAPRAVGVAPVGLAPPEGMYMAPPMSTPSSFYAGPPGSVMMGAPPMQGGIPQPYMSTPSFAPPQGYGFNSAGFK
jgi:clathrin heavy chain